MANLGGKALGRKLSHWEYGAEGTIGALGPLIIFLLLSSQDSGLFSLPLIISFHYIKKPSLSYSEISQVQSNRVKKP